MCGYLGLVLLLTAAMSDVEVFATDSPPEAGHGAAPFKSATAATAGYALHKLFGQKSATYYLSVHPTPDPLQRETGGRE